MEPTARKLTAIALAGLLAGCSSGGGDRGIDTGDDAPAYTPPTPGLRADVTIEAGGRTRYFDYVVPSGVGVDAPLVILLHGGTQNKSSVVDGTSGATAWLDVAEANGLLLVIPNGTGANGDTNAASARWNDCRSDQQSGSEEDDVAFVSALIDWAQANPDFRLDPDRVYVTGASNGGLMSYRVALELGDKVAAIAAFIANNPLNYDQPCIDAINTTPREPVSVFMLNGTVDVLMPYFGGEVAFGTGGFVDSAVNTSEFWRNWNAAPVALPPFSYPDADPTDGSTVIAETFDGGQDGSAVRFLTVIGGGHTIPSLTYFSTGNQNRDIEGAAEAWAFLEVQRR